MRNRANGRATIALLERAMAEPQRTFSLSKARHMIDANHAISKTKAAADKEGRTPGEKMSKILAKTPLYLKERVQGGQVDLPRVELVQPSDGNEEEKKMVAVMKYVLRDQAEYGEMGGMSADVFVELLEMMAPKWDAIRGGDGDGGGGVGGGGGL
jgi:hypothetical protein